LATGGTATVYLGCLRSEAGFSRVVGIKRLHEHHAKDERLVKALLAEARIVSRIRHPNVVSVLDIVAENAEKLVVLDYVHGESLSRLVLEARQASEPIPLGIALRIGVDALEGLHAAHEATGDTGVPLLVVHRDVSPQNIMVDVDGQARIIDFGIAKALERPFTTTHNGEFRGKLAYAAPEHIAGLAVDRRTDVWAMGMVLWELVAERRFFADAALDEIVRRINGEVIPPPSTVNPSCPAAIDAIVLRALERDPDARFASAREMALALEKVGLLASHREVGRWVRTLARERIDERSRMLTEMETELRRSPPTGERVASSAMTDDATRPPPIVERAPRRWPAIVLAALATAAAAFAGARSSARGSSAEPARSPPTIDSPAHVAVILPSSTIIPSPPLVKEPDSQSSAGPVATTRPAKNPTNGRPRSTAPRPTSESAGHPPRVEADPLNMDDRK
jgi:serine/threonine-protein kinase